MGVKRPGREANDRRPCSFEFDGYSRYQEIHFLCAKPEFFAVFHRVHRVRRQVVCVCVFVCVCVCMKYSQLGVV